MCPMASEPRQHLRPWRAVCSLSSLKQRVLLCSRLPGERGGAPRPATAWGQPNMVHLGQRTPSDMPGTAPPHPHAAPEPGCLITPADTCPLGPWPLWVGNAGRAGVLRHPGMTRCVWTRFRKRLLSDFDVTVQQVAQAWGAFGLSVRFSRALPEARRPGSADAPPCH